MKARRALSEQNQKRIQKFKDNVVRHHLFGNDSYRIDFKDGSSIYVSISEHQNPVIKVNGFSDSMGQECADLLRMGIVDIPLTLDEFINVSKEVGYIAPSLRE